MDFSADFTAIDFETANRRRDSACQLAAVIVRGGRIVDQSMWMIRPEPLYFSRGNIEIHGITPEKVRGEAVFGDLWSDIASRIGEDCLVAHNASFDIGVLLACLRQADHPIPDLHFTCTRAVARRVWPHRPRFGLKPLADWLGIRFKHHDALEDSVACAKILLAAGVDREAESLEDLESRLSIHRGRAGDWGYRGPRAAATTRTRRSNRTSITRNTEATIGVGSSLPFLYPGQVPKAIVGEPSAGYQSPSHPAAAEPTIDVQRLLIRAEFIRPLAGQRVAFTGDLRSLSRAEAELLATRLGGLCQPAIDQTTDTLVAGRCQASRNVVDGIGEQSRIRILDETAFLELVTGPAADVSAK